jgi:hypothetical protein
VGTPLSHPKSSLLFFSSSPDLLVLATKNLEYPEYGATAPAAPRLSAFSGAAGVGVSFDALPAFTYRIQSSPDLKTWTDVMSIGPLATETDINQMVTPPWYSNCYFRLIRQ